MSKDRPWDDSLWMDCLLELMARCRQEGIKSLPFVDVDELVIEKSKKISTYTIDD